MDFELTDEQKLIAESAREFADKEIIPRVRDNDRAMQFDRELARKLGEVGYLGAPVSEEYGGRGLDYIGYALIVEQVGRARLVLAHRRLGADVARLRLDRGLGHRGAEAGVAAAPVLRRGARLLRADRARHRLRRRQPSHPRHEDRLRLVDHGQQDVDLDRQRRRGRVGLRTDRPGKKHKGLACVPGPHRRRGRLQRAGDPRQARAPRLGHRRDRRSTRSRCPTRRCSARSATASRWR